MQISLKKKTGEQDGYLLCSLVAIELFMSFSFLGYIHIEPISITFVYIPVLVAGCLLGPKEAALVGTVFGLASMWKATAFYIGAGDAIFSPFMSGRPVESFLLSVGSRMAFGFIIGFLYLIAKRTKYPLIGIVLVSTVGRTIHAFCVYAFMGLLFPEAGFGMANTWDDLLRADYLPMAAATDFVVILCYMLGKTAYVKKLKYHLHMVDHGNALISYRRRWLMVLGGLVFLSSISVAMYFTDRITRVILQHGVNLTEEISYDIMHLQIQFLFGMIALAVLLIIVITIYQKNSLYLYYEAKLDGLTGLLSRQQFFQEAERLLEGLPFEKGEKTAYFIMIDVDLFKKINDQYGHPAGDKVLVEIAAGLKKAFGKKGLTGRLGGDEFAVFIHHFMTEKELKELLTRLKEDISRIDVLETAVTCSVGVIPIGERCTADEMYHRADVLLYEAKRKGRDQFVFEERP